VDNTPLHVASESEHDDDEVAKLLLEHGAEVDPRQIYRWTPLHLASLTGNGKVAVVLLRRGADMDARNDVKWTPLHMASQEGHSHVVEALLAHGADVDSEAGVVTALHLATYYGHVEVVRMLIERHAYLRTRDKDGETPLELARLAEMRNHHEIARILRTPLSLENRVEGLLVNVR
jgi:ankyrin repeat protein